MSNFRPCSIFKEFPNGKFFKDDEAYLMFKDEHSSKYRIAKYKMPNKQTPIQVHDFDALGVLECVFWLLGRMPASIGSF
jgi:hypothetical protein